MEKKTFNLYGVQIEFNEDEIKEINIIKTIYIQISKLIKKNFERGFYELNNKFKNEINRVKDSYDISDFYYKYTDEMTKKLLISCNDIKYLITNILKEVDSNFILTDEIESSIEGDIEDGITYNYPYFYYEETDKDFIRKAINYNDSLRNNYKEKILFFHAVATNISISLTESLLMQLDELEDNTIALDDDSSILTFDINEIFYYMVYNKTKKMREKVETNGLNDLNKERYIKSFQISPFNLEPYLFLTETLGDKNYELQDLYDFIFGDKILEIYKSNLIKKRFLQRYNMSVLDNTKEEEEAYKIIKFIGDLRSRYGLKMDTELNLKSENMITRIQRDKKTVNGIEYKTEEQADIVRKNLQKFYSKVDKSSLLNMQISLDKLNNEEFNEIELQNEINKLNEELKEMKIEYKKCNDVYTKKRIESTIIIFFVICIMFYLISWGFIGIVIDVFAFLAILGFNIEMKNMRDKKNQYIEYCNFYLNGKNKKKN